MSDFDAMNIQWFPGHMSKTRRYIEKNIGLVDIVAETVDARCIRASQNPDFDRLLTGKPAADDNNQDRPCRPRYHLTLGKQI